MITVDLDRYQLLETLGKGGMGVVFKARDEVRDRTVALKILRPEVVGERGFRSRFLREARAASALDHPSIARVYEVGEERFDTDMLLALGLTPQPDRHAVRLPFIALEWVQGRVLDELIEEGCEIEEVVDLMRQILSALEAAHAIGVIHRDLKPANVMVTAEGRAKLLDFGLAKILPGADSELGTGSQLTLDGMVMGTLPYLAPEQLQASDVRRRSDLFSLGVLTYELLTGETPFPGSTMVEYARAILTRPAQPPSDHRPDVPEWLDELVLSLLAIEPEERPSAAEIRNDLDRRIGPVPTASPPTASPTSEPVEKAPEPEGMSTTGAGTKEADSGVAPVADSPSPAAAAATAAAAAAATATGPATALAARRESSAAGPVLPPEVSEAREMAPSQMTPSQMDGVAGGRGPGNLVAATADEVSSHGSATWPLVEDLHGLGTWQKALWILSLLALAAVLTARFGLL